MYYIYFLYIHKYIRLYIYIYNTYILSNHKDHDDSNLNWK